VFRQWKRGVEEANGEFIWIAEADDLSEDTFLEEVLKPFDDKSVVMSYCQSKQMTTDGEVACDDYLNYVSDISDSKWREYYLCDGEEEITESLSVKNTIPNVSAIVFKKEVLSSVLKENIEEISQYSVAGDWLTYIYVLRNGKIAFTPFSLNKHRRHEAGVTISKYNIALLEEIMKLQQKVISDYSLDQNYKANAIRYAEELYNQFGLVTESEPGVSDNKSLSEYLA
jgi:hypothetical protein